MITLPYCVRYGYYVNEIDDVMKENMDCEGNCDECPDIKGAERLKTICEPISRTSDTNQGVTVNRNVYSKDFGTVTYKV